MVQRITFRRIDTVTLEFAETDPAMTQRYWTLWAQQGFALLSPIDLMLAGKTPSDHMIAKDIGKWTAISADPDFPVEREVAPAKRRSRK